MVDTIFILTLDEDIRRYFAFYPFASNTFNMDVASFRLALQRCGVAQAEARNAIIAQGYEWDMNRWTFSRR